MVISEMSPGITSKTDHKHNNHETLITTQVKRPGNQTVNNMSKSHPSVFSKELE